MGLLDQVMFVNENRFFNITPGKINVKYDEMKNNILHQSLQQLVSSAPQRLQTVVKRRVDASHDPDPTVFRCFAAIHFKITLFFFFSIHGTIS